MLDEIKRTIEESSRTVAMEIKRTIQQSSRALARADDPYLQKVGAYPYEKYPCCVYFYYVLKADADGYSEVRHYCHGGNGQPLMPTDAEAIVGQLIDNARQPRQHQLPPQTGENWKFVVWDRISYVAIFIDDPTVSIPANVLDITTDYYGTDNHSFFDAWQQPMKNATAILCIDHMKADQQGTQLGRVAEYFHFDLATTPRLKWLGEKKYPDSGGTNMGPPLGPP